MKQKLVTIAFMLAGAVLLAGCPKKNTTLPPATAGSQAGGGASTNANGAGASTSGSDLGNGANGANGMGANATGGGRNVIYFDFDKSDIKPEFADIVKTNAVNLTSHPTLKMKLEGNTDERGTREYNIGLGERRAQAVRRALMLQGVSENQLSTTSFGSERPAVEGDDESAWAQNRRVELVPQP
jgi:peptidoglycan-associated lipoprotein